MTVLSKPPFFSGLCCFEEDTEWSVGGSWLKNGLIILNSQKRGVMPQPIVGAIPEGIDQVLPKQYEDLFKEDCVSMYQDLYNHELKDILAKRYLKVSGNHAELVSRLGENHESKTQRVFNSIYMIVEDDFRRDQKKMKYDNEIPKLPNLSFLL